MCLQTCLETRLETRLQAFQVELATTYFNILHF